MMPASNNRSGGTVNQPDQCLNTWVNFAKMTDAETFSPNVFIACGNAINMASVLALSYGDDPDILVYVPTIGPAFFPMGIPNILVNGIPAVSLGCCSISNAGNATQGCVAVPSDVNVFMMYAGEEPHRAPPAAPSAAATSAAVPSAAGMSREELEQLLRGLANPEGPGRGVLLNEMVGYFRIGTFTSAVPAMVYGAVRDLEAQGMRVLILDLRDSPGGEVTAALELAGDFLPAGTPLCTLRDADGDETEYRARGGEPWRMPLIVLVNGNTASAAELFAGSLQAHGRAVVAGERTYGKGLVQTVASRAEDGSLDRVSVATCSLPDGRAIQGVGVVPDVLADARRDPLSRSV